jgi:hypothetical protein
VTNLSAIANWEIFDIPSCMLQRKLTFKVPSIQVGSYKHGAKQLQ